MPKDIRKLILSMLDKKGEIKASDVVKAAGFSRAYINKIIQSLIDEGKIVLIGRANKARYVFAEKNAVKRAREKILSINLELKNAGLSEDEVLDDIKKKTGIFAGMDKNVSSILDYAFLEMLNNAIEHSRSKMIKISMQKDERGVSFNVVDAGVGIFRNIMKEKGLNDVMEAMQDLLKGKQTTAPALHSGEGIFFTSRAADLLVIQGSNKKLIFNNILEDIFIKDIKPIAGTKVAFSISLKSDKNLESIFRQYSDSSFEFSKTSVIVRLYKTGEQYISRSQARRVVTGLDKFKSVTLDFDRVETVGQGFADEIFRVWKMSHPSISVNVINANENIQFMIKRVR